MDLEYVDVGLLKPHKDNPKIHTPEQVEAIRNSIKKHGWLQNLVIDEDNTILIGHGRWQSCDKGERVPCLRLSGLTELSKKRLMLIDNTLNLETGFDPIAFEEIVEILTDNNYPIEDMGFVVEVLGETENRSVDKSELKKSMERYLNGETKRLVLYYESEKHEEMERRIDKLMTSEQVPMRCDLVLAMLLNYEREEGKL